MNNNKTFLGTGWSFPPTFERQTGQVQMVSAEEDILQSMQILFTTALGERVMLHDYGSEMSRFLFEEIDHSLINSIKNTVSNAIIMHEPRVDPDEVDVRESADQPGLLLISIRYTVRATNTRYNMVFPFYINEATLLPG
ncbi:MAG: GPW/gp25 family protein [Sinomicrobium sp.]|nr:GPW/gp25 family protein [Sinomicrobium sp.]